MWVKSHVSKWFIVESKEVGGLFEYIVEEEFVQD